MELHCSAVRAKKGASALSVATWGASDGSTMRAHAVRFVEEYGPGNARHLRNRALSRALMRATPLFAPSLDPKQSTMTHLTCGYTAATVYPWPR